MNVLRVIWGWFDTYVRFHLGLISSGVFPSAVLNEGLRQAIDQAQAANLRAGGITWVDDPTKVYVPKPD